MKLSIIMPCYNSSDTIKEAIDSVRNQTSDEWQLIIVNDGSTDNTLEIASTYAKQDSRINVINSRVRRGVAESRNVGINTAEFDYIGFLDSDDTLDRNFVSTMLLNAEKHKVDIVWCQYNLVNVTSGEIVPKDNNIPKNELISNIELLNCFYTQVDGIASLCNKIYSSNYIKREMAVTFNPERRRAEDWEFNMTLFQKKGRGIIIPDILYNYRRFAKPSAMSCYRDIDFNMFFRSLELLKTCNMAFNLGFSDYSNGYPILEHLYQTAELKNYENFRQKITTENFQKYIVSINLCGLPISYKLPALFMKKRLNLLSFLIIQFEKFLQKKMK